MYRMTFIVVTALLMCASAVYAQTPVERLIAKYADVQGAKEMDAEGAKMPVARIMIKQTPVASIASQVEKVSVLKMGGASKQYRSLFLKELGETLKSYDYIGLHDSKNGEVKIYILKSGPETVKELVIYNPELYVLNSLMGAFSMDDLQKLE